MVLITGLQNIASGPIQYNRLNNILIKNELFHLYTLLLSGSKKGLKNVVGIKNNLEKSDFFMQMCTNKMAHI